MGLLGAPLLRRTWIALAAGLAAAPALAANGGDEAVEYAIKATYLYKFAPFVQWPPEAAPSERAVFNICLTGTDPFGPVLDEAVATQKVAGGAIAVRRLKDSEQPAGCHVYYIGKMRGLPASAALKATAGLPVLTITDDTHRPDQRGAIHFVIRDNRVRFEIDEAIAAAHNLVISAKLLSLAVKSRAGAPGDAP